MSRAVRAVRVVLPLLPLLIAAPASAQQVTPPVAELLGRLTAPEWSVRCAAARGLMRDPDPQQTIGPAVVALLRTAPAYARDEVLLTAGALAPSLTVETLAELLVEGSPDVRAWAAHALGRIGREAGPALQGLLGALDSSDYSLRQSALVALERIDPDTTIERLTELLESGDPGVRRWAAGGLGSFGKRARAAIPGLLEALEQGDSATKETIATTLLHIDPRQAVDCLAGLLSHESPSIRHLAASRLESLGRRARPAIPALVEVVKERPTSLSGSQALQTLVRLDRDLAVGTIRELLGHPKWSMREQALSQVGVLGKAGRSLSPLIVQKLEEGPDALRSTAARALGELGAADVVPRLIDLLGHAQGPVAKAAAEALGELGPKAGDAAPGLVRLIQHEDFSTRLAAGRALRRLGDGAVPAVVEGLKIEDSQTRERMVRILARMGDRAKVALPALEDLAARDPDPLVRRAAERAVTRLTGERR